MAGSERDEPIITRMKRLTVDLGLGRHSLDPLLVPAVVALQVTSVTAQTVLEAVVKAQQCMCVLEPEVTVGAGGPIPGLVPVEEALPIAPIHAKAVLPAVIQALPVAPFLSCQCDPSSEVKNHC